MSFSEDVKIELSGVYVSGCCRMAECFAFLGFSRTFSEEEICFKTMSDSSAERLRKLLKTEFHTYSVKTESGEKRKTYKVTVGGNLDRKKIFSALKRSNTGKILKKECCKSAFLRGLFLAYGTVSDPEKSYNLEFNFKDRILAELAVDLISNYGFTPKIYQKGEYNTVCIKDSTAIEDLLARIGCSQGSLQIIGAKIYKNMRESVNRKTNCETANSKKTVDASIRQRMAIEYLDNTKRLDTLPEELLKVALLRFNNPDASLSELCKLCDEPITRSGINHRLERIIKYAENLKEKSL